MNSPLKSKSSAVNLYQNVEFLESLLLTAPLSSSVVIYCNLNERKLCYFYAVEYTGGGFFTLRMRRISKYISNGESVKLHSSHFVKVYYKFLQEFEEHPDTKGVRTLYLSLKKSRLCFQASTFVVVVLRTSRNMERHSKFQNYQFGKNVKLLQLHISTYERHFPASSR